MPPPPAAPIPVAELTERLQLSRSRLYDLIKELRITPRRVGRAAFVTVDQYGILSDCVDWLKRGRSLAEYLAAHPPEMEIEPPQSGLVADQSSDTLLAVLALLQQDRQQLAIALAAAKTDDSPDEIDQLERRLRVLLQLADGRLSLDNVRMAALLDVSPDRLRRRGQEFEEYGLVFERVQQGRTLNWRVRRA